MNTESINITELLTALAAASEGQSVGGGLTVRELCASSGYSEDRIRKMLRMAIDAGRIRSTRKFQPCIDGRMHPVAAYTLAPAGDAHE